MASIFNTGTVFVFGAMHALEPWHHTHWVTKMLIII